jgi:protein ImuB
VLWLAAYFRHLPIDALVRTYDASQASAARVHDAAAISSELLLPSCALVVSDNVNRRHCVYSVNECAHKLGIRVGMSVASAKVLHHQLVVLPRNKERELRTLTRIAEKLLYFSPCVSINKEIGQANIVMEVSRSQRLFGGIKELLKRISQTISCFTHSVTYGIAPTPLAAEAFSRVPTTYGKFFTALSAVELREKITETSIAYFSWPQKVNESLNTLGLQTFGDIIRQPLPGLRRRFGQEFVLDLEKALGLAADIRDFHPPLRTFERHLDLMCEIVDRSLLLAPTKSLLDDLERYLSLRGAGVNKLCFDLMHGRDRRTTIEISSRVYTRRAAYWFAIARDRIDRLSLGEGVFEIALSAGDFLEIKDENTNLLGSNTSYRENQFTLFDRVSGDKEGCRLYRITTVSDHRPELAFQSTIEAKRALKRLLFLRKKRPIWLLHSPRSLVVAEGFPQYNGALSLLTSPERIDTGWWDNKPVARDYFVAINPEREVCWVFRDYSRGKRWYLHGFFS